MRRAIWVIVIGLISTLMTVTTATATDHCTSGDSTGDWGSYGRDLLGTRHAADETVIGTENVGSLQLAWRSDGVDGGQSTAVVAGNCVYVAGVGSGLITALDLSDGSVVWSVTSAPDYPTKRATNAVSVVDGVVYANVSESDGSLEPGSAPIGVALDADTGDVLYQSDPIQFGEPTTAVASAVAFDDLQLVVTNGKDGGPEARPGFGIIDAATGDVLTSRTTIPTEDLDAGFAGGGQWATPIVDVESGYAFNGTANPYSKKKEHRYDNAIIKIDVDPDRIGTFGTIVDAYKGNVDQFIPGLERQILCDEFGDQIGYHPCCDFSVTCVQLDIDFGASPTGFRNSKGELIVGELQKSGIFHAVYADTMQQAWETMVSTIPPGTAGNSSSSANDGERVYVLANPGVLHSLDPDTGRLIWSAPLVDAANYHPVSVANGVVYALSNHGLLTGFDAEDGRPLLVTSLNLDAGAFCSTLSGGVTISKGTVIANCDGILHAYRVPA